MPINNEERARLELAIASFDAQDSVATARLLWETLSAARATPDNQGGLGPDQIFALGRLVYDKAEWSTLAKVEEATGKRPIRFPLMRAVDSVFRAGLPNALPKLPEEHRQALGTSLSKMDPDELMLLTVMLYDTLLSAEFIVGDPTRTGELHPLAKWLTPGWTWEQLKQMEPVVRGVCIPLINACDGYFRDHFPTIFRNSEEVSADAPPAETAPQTPANDPPSTPTPTTESPAEPVSALSPDEEEAAATDEEGGVSDTDPFIADAQQAPAVEAQPEEDDSRTPEPPSSPTSQPPTIEEAPMPVPAQTVSEDTPTPTNGHKLSKRERRELKRQQREEAGK